MPGNGSAEGKDWWESKSILRSKSQWMGGGKEQRRRKYIECFLFVQFHLNFKYVYDS